jgi:hypothetical protein
MLRISLQILRPGIAAEAIAAVASQRRAQYVQVTMSIPSDVERLQQNGWHLSYPTWDAFMVKPLVPGLTAEDARHLFRIGTDQFLISWLDTT